MKNEKKIRCNECKKILRKKLYGPITELNTKKKFDIYYCSFCKFYKTHKVPKKLDLFYPNTYRNFKGLKELALKFLYSLNFVRLNFNKGDIKKIYEIGCGPCFFLNQFNQKGWKCTGVERDKQYIKKLSKYNKKINFITIDKFMKTKKKIEGKILMWHSLEHIEKPHKFLNYLSKISKINTELMFAVPNINSYQLKLFGKYWIHLDPPRHINHFNIKTLKIFLEKKSFKVIKNQNFFPALDFMGFVGSITCYLNTKGLKMPVTVINSNGLFDMIFSIVFTAAIGIVYIPFFFYGIISKSNSSIFLKAKKVK